jgi:hypothetical protein
VCFWCNYTKKLNTLKTQRKKERKEGRKEGRKKKGKKKRNAGVLRKLIYPIHLKVCDAC